MGQLAKLKEQAMTMTAMLEQADVIVKSGLMPKEINTKEKVVSVGIFGRSHGLSFEEATIGGQVYVFEAKGGKLCLMVKSEKKLDMMMSRLPGFYYEIITETNDELSVDFHRLMNGNKVTLRITVSVKDPEIVPLLGKDNWKYRKVMLWYTALRRLGNKWPDYKREASVEMVELEEAETAVSDLTETKTVTIDAEFHSVNTETGEATPIEQPQTSIEEAKSSQEQPQEEKAMPTPTQEQENSNLRNYACSGCGKSISSSVASYSVKEFKRTLCMKCQAEEGNK